MDLSIFLVVLSGKNKIIGFYFSDKRSIMNKSYNLEFGKFNYAFIFLCGIMQMSWFYEVVGISYYLPVAECDLGITSKLDYGIINGSANAGLVLSFYLWGLIGDTNW